MRVCPYFVNHSVLGTGVAGTVDWSHWAVVVLGRSITEEHGGVLCGTLWSGQWTEPHGTPAFYRQLNGHFLSRFLAWKVAMSPQKQSITGKSWRFFAC